MNLWEIHVKAAQNTECNYFSIKIASGFYNNTQLGLPTNNGMIIALSSQTGRPIALLDDEGWITSIRTAAAGELAAGLKPVSQQETIGIIGTGTQAELQAIWTYSHLKLKKVLIFGRSFEKSQALCKKLNKLNLHAQPAQTVKELCHNSNILTPPQHGLLLH